MTASQNAQQPSSTRSSGERFPRVQGRGWGYSIAQVDRLLDSVAAEPWAAAVPSPPDDADAGRPAEELDALSPAGDRAASDRLRSAVFSRQRGGYEPQAVDRRLDQLHEQLSRAEAERFAAAHGHRAWEQRIERLSDAVLSRLERPDRQRFRTPAGTSTRGYAQADVDDLCAWALAELRAQRGPEPREIREAAFGSAQGESAYEEQQVDACLEALEDLLRTEG